MLEWPRSFVKISPQLGKKKDKSIRPNEEVGDHRHWLRYSSQVHDLDAHDALRAIIRDRGSIDKSNDLIIEVILNHRRTARS